MNQDLEMSIKVLAMLQSCSPGEKVHGEPVELAIERLQKSIEIRQQIKADQLIHRPQGGMGIYLP